ncbi:1-aminocyclopropane-1-carboxylate deaminase [Pseudomonas sp. SWI6]|uniref:Pyridoxal-phosphate dependent enzyme n=1 Tax=Pseudomonas taiwanensis TaxID=470150 RepID=A0ABR6VCY1_9PSED|nr:MULTISPECIES: pyridoxal-phosphate dependent enzyme [Pseudomonas]AGZ34295.1 1-aminocyclopropane-1-carboxylate deaminase [Pseudomonas sp. VLB120]AVD84156.1 1-aminocyclopropane-1-carboxylate deaminase [Pseudomonas sp. SWI6]AVD86367.1 1-aminocyclopropane-1-carboxylate deaminase [Pseudomonas sp. SWI44]MBC3478383.1 pyridoxal-phosphate dependent enzyme [Pseudomonas taiwanensis]MBC3493783.1 pyridoxal-phosphate dependent enzyme [Pseudomonas taiwanensis]
MSPCLSELPSAFLQTFHLPWLQNAAIEAAILRLDLIDPLISGNKWFKLRHHLQRAHEKGAPGLISLGGNHSNHLHALAAAGKRFGFATVGLLRGHAQDTPTVRDLQGFGMELHWLGYDGYRARHEPGFWAPWQARYPGWHCIPEGGGGLAGAEGCAAIVEQAQAQLGALGWSAYDAWWLAAGTGTTLAGLVLAEAGRHAVHGALAVPWDHGVPQTVRELVGADGYQLHEACRGGFAKFDEDLLAFVDACERHSGVPLEAVYTGKALLALRDQAEAGLFEPGTRLIFLHTGGLQGRRGYL